MTPIRRPERRGAPRVASALPLILTDGTGEIVTQAENLSVSGAYCTLSQFLAPMTKLRVRLELPQCPQTTIRCEGVVVRVEPAVLHLQHTAYKVAILFSDFSERSRSALAQYIRQRLHLNAPNIESEQSGRI